MLDYHFNHAETETGLAARLMKIKAGAPYDRRAHHRVKQLSSRKAAQPDYA